MSYPHYIDHLGIADGTIQSEQMRVWHESQNFLITGNRAANPLHKVWITPSLLERNKKYF